MRVRSIFLLGLFCIVLVAGCTLPGGEVVINVPTLTALPTYTDQPTLTLLPTYTPQATQTATSVASKTPAQSATPDIVPTYTPLPTLTLLPTSTLSGPKVWVTVTPYTAATDMPPGELNAVWSCEDFSISPVYSNPELVQTITGRFSVGIFLMLRVKIAAASGKSYGALTSESFRMLGSLYGRDVTYYLDRNNSDYANSRWETAYLDNSVTSGGYETYLVFDVNPFTTNYALEFCPIPKGEQTPVCCVTFSLPEVKR